MEDILSSDSLHTSELIAQLETMPLDIPDARRILEIIERYLPVDEIISETGRLFGADFSIADEVSMQLKVLAGLRRSLVSESGRPLETSDPVEIKNMLTASMSMVKTLVSLQADIVNHERLQAIERAFINVVSKIEPELRNEFEAQLKTNLEAIN